MSSIPENSTEQPLLPVRRENVVMGRQDYLSVLLRLTSAELYKIRRRLMSKILGIIAIVVMVLGFGLVSLGAIFVSYSAADLYLPPRCSSAQGQNVQGCLDHDPTQSELAAAEAQKQANLRGVSSILRLPSSLTMAAQIAQGIGLILIIILAGTIVGGEYGAGTIRVLYTRGPTRTQFLLAKILALLACTVLGLVVLLPLGIVLGALLNLITGIPFDLSFFTLNWLGHAVLYVGVVILGLLLYALLALCLSTLGRSTAAGVAGALVWWGLENILSGVLLLVSTFARGPLGDFLKAVPDYFIGNNISALLANQNVVLTGGQPSAISDLHAILVLLAYTILFSGVSWWVNRSRDVTN